MASGQQLSAMVPPTNRLWGWALKDNSPRTFKPIGSAIISPNNNDGAYVIDAGYTGIGGYNYTVDFLGGLRNENSFIQKYRDVALFPEVDKAIRELVDEAIVIDENGKIEVTLNLDETGLSDKIKDKLNLEFKTIQSLIDFQNQGADLFKNWYTDGRLYLYVVIDTDNEKKGIQELRIIDPLAIKKIREEVRQAGRDGVMVSIGYREYFTFNPGYAPSNIQGQGYGLQGHGQDLQIAADAVVMATSGVWDASRTFMVGHLHKAIRPANQLRMMEDATVIYRMVRAPERRVFYIETGNLPKGKAEQYIKGLIAKYRNRVSYDAATGSMNEKGSNISMLEDFWLPRSSNGKGTEITNLQGGSNLGEIVDVEYFKKNLYMALNVPFSRIKEDRGFTLGKATEISRDEVQYAKFVSSLRRRFSSMFLQLLEKQVLLKGILDRDDWNRIVPAITIVFPHDNYFTELKELEILKNRVDALNMIKEGIGLYYSARWVKKNILRQSDDEIDDMVKEIEQEKKDGVLDPANLPFDAALAKAVNDTNRFDIDKQKADAETQKADTDTQRAMAEIEAAKMAATAEEEAGPKDPIEEEVNNFLVNSAGENLPRP